MDVIARLVDAALAAGLGSAAAVSVGDGGREVFRYVRGHTRRLPDLGSAIDEQTYFDMASLTKPMVTVASMMHLVADLRFELDTPIRDLVPYAASTATVRQLLGHAAGCLAHVEYFRWLRGARLTNSREALVERAAREPVGAAAPTYSDLGYIVLASIVERIARQPLEQAFARCVAEPLGLTARFAPTPLANAVATELDDRGLVCGLVHDENAYYGGRVCGHAGLFASIGDVAKFAAEMVAPRHFSPEVVTRFVTDAPTPGATWRLGWDAPSYEPGVSQLGDRWLHVPAVGHTGFTGTSLWLDLAHQRWFALLTNRVHPTPHATTAHVIKVLRRAIGDAVVEAFG